MARSTIAMRFLFFGAALLISLRSNCLGLKKHCAMFIFGDSLFNAGNNNYINTERRYKANHSPYGQTFFKYRSGRFSDGRLVPDFIGLPLIPPYLQPGFHNYTDGANFASAGVGALVETDQGLAIDLETQVKLFKNMTMELRRELGEAEARKLLSEAVYLISIGSNDYLPPVLSKLSPEEYVDMVIGNLTSATKEIFKEGGRKFGVEKLGPLGCTPQMKIFLPKAASKSSCIDDAILIAKLHNRKLSKALESLSHNRLGLKWFKYSTTDFYTVVTERIDFPSKFGFKEVSVACCGSSPYNGGPTRGGKTTVKADYFHLCNNPSSYLFFDSVHPTERANQQFADIMWNGHGNQTSPYTLKQLFSLSTLAG